ncbi:hypothetical protein [Subtercola endophyticus]|uniref:hypothetical protein n=1 Tax=Subtercola endophyticus TaxID=2895559 RepID=UPI001E32A461|nr:hypothetical protein [Subtercola endophyticus]UFS58831.1 hypothetical protein LQ955_17825 [Subtercola endophyticus]
MASAVVRNTRKFWQGWQLLSRHPEGATHRQRPLAAGCLVATCAAAADEHVTVTEGGLPIRFAVCREHCYDIRWNALEPTTARDRMRSMISLA